MKHSEFTTLVDTAFNSFQRKVYVLVRLWKLFIPLILQRSESLRGIPGIGAAFAFRPETAKPMRELAHILLFEPGRDASLSSRDRELIASYVSARNTCYFTQTSHGAAAASQAGGSPELVEAVCADPSTANISEKLKALLVIAAHVQADAKTVSPSHIEAARQQGATDLEIHDAVLIAAAFCMYDRYVSALDRASREGN